MIIVSENYFVKNFFSIPGEKTEMNDDFDLKIECSEKEQLLQKYEITMFVYYFLI